MAYEDERMQILEMIESGQISASEGMQLLQSIMAQDQGRQSSDQKLLEDEPEPVWLPGDTQTAAIDGRESNGKQSETPEPVVGEVYSHPSGSEPTGLPPDAAKWRSWWIIPLWIGVGITVMGGILMYTALQSSGIGFWFVGAGLLFTLGLILMIMAWQSRTARWLHLRIQQRPGHTPERIALSFPLPIRLTAWFFRTFRGHIPGIQNTSIDEIILALDQSATPENPIFISIDDEDEGENVQIFIG